MYAVIPSRGLQLFAKMVQCMSKIGEDLYIDGTPKVIISLTIILKILQEFVLRTFNQTRSAFFCFQLHKNFFEDYQILSPDAFRCKLLLKVTVFFIFKINPSLFQFSLYYLCFNQNLLIVLKSVLFQLMIKIMLLILKCFVKLV